MKIGMISDTHGYLDEKVFTYFKDCDEVWHAGDIGTLALLERIESFKPAVAVYGNIDGHDIRLASTENQLINRGGKKILITHIAGKPPKYNPRVRELIKLHQPDLLVCGHSHLLKVERDHQNNLLFINPGAAGKQGFHKIKTLLRMDIQEGQFKNLEVIELGKRGEI